MQILSPFRKRKKNGSAGTEFLHLEDRPKPSEESPLGDYRPRVPSDPGIVEIWLFPTQ